MEAEVKKALSVQLAFLLEWNYVIGHAFFVYIIRRKSHPPSW